jgi:hypothetical protein
MTYIIQDNIGNYAEAEDLGGASTAAAQLFEDDLANVHTVSITRRHDLEQIKKDFDNIVAEANKAAWGQ